MPKPSSKEPTIDSIILALPPELAEIAREMRAVIRSVGPGLEECVKWGGPNWRARKLVLCLMVYPNHLNLGFWRGAELAESFPEIEGTGKSLRHVRLRDVAQVRSPGMRRLVAAAIKLDGT